MRKLNPTVLGLIVVLFFSSLGLNDAVSVVSKNKQKVCIIGAGAAGLAATKLFADKPNEYNVVTFEQKSDVGGLWIYSDNTVSDEHGLPVQSSVYKYMRTNSPKELMSYPDYFFSGGGEKSCVPHKTVLQHLRNYTEHFNLRKYIQLDTLVEKVTRINGNGDWRTTQWKIQTEDLNSNVSKETICDAIVVCNGHNFQPREPEIPGIETFTGQVMHSHLFRVPDDFAGKKVVTLGAGPSGLDISIQISERAEKVFLSHNGKNINWEFPSNIVQVPGVVGASGNELILKNGSRIQADVLVFCTGYNYYFPFLDESTNIVVDDNQVQYVYKHIVNVEHPTMGFIGVANLVSDYPMFYTQVKYFMALLEGKAQLPSKADMLKDCELNGKAKRHAHRLGAKQWAYNDELAELGGFEKIPAFYKKGYNLWVKNYVANGIHFRDSLLRILNKETGEVDLIPYYELQKNQ